jgi:hypothetical protein
MLWKMLLRSKFQKIQFFTFFYSDYDICHEILKDADKSLGAIYLEGDLILPNGHVLE